MYNKYEQEELEKQRIFNIALEVMNEVGYEGLSIRGLCAKAEISTGKFYSLFHSKADLLRFYFDRAIQSFQEEVRQWENWDSLDIKQQIVDFYTWYLEYTVKFGLDFVSHFYSSSNEVFTDSASYTVIISLTETFFQKAVQNGYVVPDNKTIHEIACDLCVIVKGCIFQWCINRGSFDLPKYAKDLLTSCVRSLL